MHVDVYIHIFFLSEAQFPVPECLVVCFRFRPTASRAAHSELELSKLCQLLGPIKTRDGTGTNQPLGQNVTDSLLRLITNASRGGIATWPMAQLRSHELKSNKALN